MHLSLQKTGTDIPYFTCQTRAQGASSTAHPALRWRFYRWLLNLFLIANALLATTATGRCNGPVTPIAEVQGRGEQSSLSGQTLWLEGIVTASYQGPAELGGFFMQQEDAQTDGDPTTSEAIFVFHSSQPVAVGDQVRVHGTVNEYFGQTQLNKVQDLHICSNSNPLPGALALELPMPHALAFEAVESMRVSFADDLQVNDLYNLGRYGQLTVANGRRFVPTEVAEPGPAAAAVRAANRLNQLLIDDANYRQNPDPISFPAPALTADNSVRVGDRVSGLIGILTETKHGYTLLPSRPPLFVTENKRPAIPIAAAALELRVATFNLQNFFNGNGSGGGFPTSRGAVSIEEYRRQTEKLGVTLRSLDADIIGLVELENDGFGPQSAISTLVAHLNVDMPSFQHYRYVDPGLARLGDDKIAVALIYRPAKVSALGIAAVLTASTSPQNASGEPLFDDQLNRPALLQKFLHHDSGEQLNIAINHFKSRLAGNCERYDDCDRGQGAYNRSRTRAALGLAQWLAGIDKAHYGHHQVIMGDLNAYSKEDPVAQLQAAGYQSLQPVGSYTYVAYGETGTLDHVLVSSSLQRSVVRAQTWNINADEPKVLDYRRRYKSPSQQEALYAPTPYRSSDHDPVIIDFSFVDP